MKVVNANAEILEHKGNPYKFIERIGRVCYKSESSTKENSARTFVNGLRRSNHLAILEHEHIYIEINKGSFLNLDRTLEVLSGIGVNINYLTKSYYDQGIGYGIISGSFRAFSEFIANSLGKLKELEEKGDYRGYWYKEPIIDLIDFLLQGYPYNELLIPFNEFASDIGEYYLKSTKGANTDFINYKLLSREDLIKREGCENSISKHLVHTVLFTCDRGVSHELVRHRPCSFAQESTRYCNYSNQKFGRELTFIKPCFFDNTNEVEDNYYAKALNYDKDCTNDYENWLKCCTFAEKGYFAMLLNGATPEQARSVLPNSVKTEIVITATEEEWKHIFELRYTGTTGKPHPQMKEVMTIAYNLLQNERRVF